MNNSVLMVWSDYLVSVPHYWNQIAYFLLLPVNIWNVEMSANESGSAGSSSPSGVWGRAPRVLDSQIRVRIIASNSIDLYWKKTDYVCECVRRFETNKFIKFQVCHWCCLLTKNNNNCTVWRKKPKQRLYIVTKKCCRSLLFCDRPPLFHFYNLFMLLARKCRHLTGKPCISPI